VYCYWPRIDLATALIDRIKRLFAGKGLITFDTKETVIELNDVKIEAFPSHHLDAMRGLPNVYFILLAARLKELQIIGVLKRKSYNETPPRVEYNLTDRGQELVEYIVNLLQWMRKWSSMTKQ
jgi:hypothetical protein